MAVRVAVLGAGAVGSRAVRQLASSPSVARVAVADADPARAAAVEAAVAERGRVRTVDADGPWWSGADVAVVAVPGGVHVEASEGALAGGVAVVSTSGAPADVEALLGLDHEARERGLSVVAGAAFAPGLSCALAALAAEGFDAVTEVHVSRTGAGGAACAGERRRALVERPVAWHDGAWTRHRPGGGRIRSWFPSPIGARDVVRAGFADPLLLVPAFPGVERVSTRVAAPPLARFGARAPLRRVPREGGPGGLRVEVRGRRGAAQDVVVLGAMDRPAVAAGAVAALVALEVGAGRVRPGAGGLAELVDPVPFLAELARLGVKAATYEGVPD